MRTGDRRAVLQLGHVQSSLRKAQRGSSTQAVSSVRATAEQQRLNAAMTAAARTAGATATAMAISAQATQTATVRQAEAERRAGAIKAGWSVVKIVGSLVGSLVIGVAALAVSRRAPWRQTESAEAPPGNDEIPPVPMPEVALSRQASDVISDASEVRRE